MLRAPLAERPVGQAGDEVVEVGAADQHAAQTLLGVMQVGAQLFSGLGIASVLEQDGGSGGLEDEF